MLFFYMGVLMLILFELSSVYFIMPLPGSQVADSIDLAYFLHSYRWVFRFVFGFILIGFLPTAWARSRKLTVFMLLVLAATFYMTQMKMAADTMFYKPNVVRMRPSDSSVVPLEKIVLGIVHEGEARAYPIQYIGYHHQIPDTIARLPVIVTYCTVCRSGRAYHPIVNGKHETFRLVGMDHFNAMFEDMTSGTWWRQVTGEAVAGPLKGQQLPVIPVTQASLDTWLAMYPQSLIMQPDSQFLSAYDDLADYESGQRKGRLTRRDTSSWMDKSWIAGVEIDQQSKAYDWNALIKYRTINDVIGKTPVTVVLTPDEKGLFAFQRFDDQHQLYFRNDTLTDGTFDYMLSGMPLDTFGRALKPIQVYQEYWHSWRTFHPATLK